MAGSVGARYVHVQMTDGTQHHDLTLLAAHNAAPSGGLGMVFRGSDGVIHDLDVTDIASMYWYTVVGYYAVPATRAGA